MVATANLVWQRKMIKAWLNALLLMNKFGSQQIQMINKVKLFPSLLPVLLMASLSVSTKRRISRVTLKRYSHSFASVEQIVRLVEMVEFRVTAQFQIKIYCTKESAGLNKCGKAITATHMIEITS